MKNFSPDESLGNIELPEFAITSIKSFLQEVAMETQRHNMHGMLNGSANDISSKGMLVGIIEVLDVLGMQDEVTEVLIDTGHFEIDRDYKESSSELPGSLVDKLKTVLREIAWDMPDEVIEPNRNSTETAQWVYGKYLGVKAVCGILGLSD